MSNIVKVPNSRYEIDLDNEQRDIHEIDDVLGDELRLAVALDNFVRAARDGTLHEKYPALKDQREVERSFSPKLIQEVKHPQTRKVQLRVWDYRAFTHPNGGTIPVLGRVEHIPVIRQMPGLADINVLWRVLVQQGLMVQNATDNEKNVAYFTNRNQLCFQARGANSLTCGTEHMHLTTSDPWNSDQLNASAYLSAGDWKFRHVPYKRGVLGSGRGFVVVKSKGHFTHEGVSHAAGFDDRSDPGDPYEHLMPEVRERAIFYNKHHHF